MSRALAVDQESVAAFRGALQGAVDPLAAVAGEKGEMVFLATKTFGQDYMTFCDSVGANDLYPLHTRSEARRRREALFPYLGQPLLHGVLSHEGFLLNVFVDKASGVVIHWEWQPEPGSQKQV
jgi:hypothetical protein